VIDDLFAARYVHSARRLHRVDRQVTPLSTRKWAAG
jgi:hypothetical protein